MGWEVSKLGKGEIHRKERVAPSYVVKYLFPYSEHCSMEVRFLRNVFYNTQELVQFVDVVSADKIICTCKPRSQEEQIELIASERRKKYIVID